MPFDPITRRMFLAAAAAGPIAEQPLIQRARAEESSLKGASSEGGIPPRPRLYFNKAERAELERRIQTDEPSKKAAAELVKRAQSTLGRDLVKEDYARAGLGQHGNYYAAASSASAAIETCGFAWLLTGDERFASHARKALKHFAQYEAWTGQEFFRRDPPWHSALETAHFTRAYALGIDWLAEAMPDDERKAACAALAKLGVEPLIRDWLDPAQRTHALDSMGHNWWMVCVGAAGLGAMSLLGDDDRAEKWIGQVADGIPEFFAYPGNVLLNKPRTFDPAGGFYESLSYANYTLCYYSYVMAALRHVFPRGFPGHRFDEPLPQLRGFFEFMYGFLYPTRKKDGAADFLTPAFGDDGNHTAFSGDAVLYLAQATRDGRYRWYFDRYCGGVSGFYQLLFHDPKVLPPTRAPEKMPLSRCLEGIGWASLRDSWEENATFLAIKCGHTWNHAHADAASFVIYAGGEPLLIDPGSCSYGRKEYRSYYTESIAHNTILVDGEGQPRSDGERGTKFDGRLYSFVDDDRCRYVLADATGPMAHLCKRFYRHFLWLDDAIVILDDLLAHKPGRFEWLFHGQSAPTFENGVMRVRSGDAQLEMSVLFPRQIEHELRRGLAPHEPDRPLDYLALKQARPSQESKFLGVIRARHVLPAMKISSRDGREWICARIEAQDRGWDLYCNLRADGRRAHRNSNQSLDGWETDAFILGLRTGAQRKILLINGSYLRRPDGTVVFDCLSQCDAVLVGDQERQFSDVFVQAPAGSRVRIGTARKPGRIMANAREIRARDIDMRDGMCVIRADAVLQHSGPALE